MGLRIETPRGGRPKGRAFLIRWVLLTVDGLLLGLVAVMSIVATERRRRIGDLVPRTLVVRADTDVRWASANARHLDARGGLGDMLACREFGVLG